MKAQHRREKRRRRSPHEKEHDVFFSETRVCVLERACEDVDSPCSVRVLLLCSEALAELE